jgi:hypothetical protein
VNRRSFFSSLATIGAAVTLAPNVFLPRFATPRWKRTRQLWVINPEWVNAPYEYVFTLFGSYLVKRPRALDGSFLPIPLDFGKGPRIYDTYPVRMTDAQEHPSPAVPA